MLEKILNWGIIILIFLLPLFFLPITTDFYDFNKNILLYCYIVILLIVWGLRMVLEKKVTFRRTPFDLPVLAIAAAFLASTIFVSPNKAEAFILPGGTGTILALTILYFLITNRPTTHNSQPILNALIASASLLSLTAIFSFLEFAKVWNLNLPDWLTQKTFTPAGGILILATFLVVTLVLAAGVGYKEIRKQRDTGKEDSSLPFVAFVALSLLLLLLGLGVSIFQLLTTNRPVLLPYQTGWQIAIETLKFSPLFGVGPTSFLVAFNQFRPAAFNLTDFWTIRFGISSNYYFHLLTTVGVVGLAAYLFLISRVVKIGLNNYKPEWLSSYLAILLIFLLLLFLPVNLLLLFSLYLLLGILGAGLITKEYTEESKTLPWIIFVPVFLFLLYASYFIGRSYLAETSFKQSLEALAQNEGTKTYNLQIKAINLAPYRVNYRLSYSQTNLALTNSLAAKTDLSDQDRQNVSTLIQQAIAEGKAAVALDPRNAVSWENLASIYRALINFAQGADSWTISAYQQAIALEPANPSLRLALGGVYYSLQKWDEAIRSFEQAVSLKPNFANGYYNLAAAYREKQDFEKATLAIETTLSLIPKDSDDWNKANAELEALKKKLGEKAEKEAKKPSPTLSQPQPLPTGIKPPLALPTGVEPEISPTPTPGQ